MFGTNPVPIKELDITELVDNLENKNVESVTIIGNEINGKLLDGTLFTTVLPYELINGFYFR